MLSPTIEALYAAPGVNTSVTFAVHPGIRYPRECDGNTSTFTCPDEACGCPYTTWLLCSLRATEATQTQQMNFLGCWDSFTTLYSSDWEYPDPQTAAGNCVNETFNDVGLYSAVVSCATGAQGENLKLEAAATMEAMFPGSVGLPHVAINGQQQEISQNGTDLWTFTQAICDAGANAGICGALKSTRVRGKSNPIKATTMVV